MESFVREAAREASSKAPNIEAASDGEERRQRTHDVRARERCTHERAGGHRIKAHRREERRDADSTEMHPRGRRHACGRCCAVAPKIDTVMGTIG